MSWQYRLVRHVQKSKRGKESEFFQIHEVFFDEDNNDKYKNMTEGGVSVFGDTKEEIQEVLDMMSGACSRTIIDYDGDKSNIIAEP